MVGVRYLLVAILSLQLSLLVESQSNTTQDAEEALKLLYHQIESSYDVLLITSANLWQSYVDNSTEIILQQLGNDIGNLTNLSNSIASIFTNYTSRDECFSALDTFLNIDNYNINSATSEQQIFINLFTFSGVELGRILLKHDDLSTEFSNCQKNEQNCDGINEGIILEVERLIPVAERITNELLLETYVSGYKIRANWELIQSGLMIDYNKVIQNTTVCLSSNIERAKVDFNSSSQTDDISKDYLYLSSVVDKTFAVSRINLVFSSVNIMLQCKKDYLVTNSRIQDAVFRANQTINALLSVPENLNITLDCSIPDLQSVVNSSLARALDEYRLIIAVSDHQQHEGYESLNITSMEVKSIQPQVQACLSFNSSCDYVSEKVAKKIGEIPFSIQKVEDITTLLMYQSVAAVWNSGAKIVRDILEDLEVGIVDLKSCIRLSLY